MNETKRSPYLGELLLGVLDYFAIVLFLMSGKEFIQGSKRIEEEVYLLKNLG